MDFFNKVVLLFLIYSFIGWLWETVYCSLKVGKFVYRGFLVGPYCPIYGFGVLLVLYFIEPYQNNIILLYILSATAVTVLEYITSYLLEKFFHASWWDYKDVPFNINGRVALPVSLFWGIGCVLIVKVIQPQVMKIVDVILSDTGNYLAVIIIGIFTVDLIYTVTNMVNFNKISQEWDAAIKKSQQNLQARKAELGLSIEQNLENIRSDYEEWKEDFTEKAKNLPKPNFNHRRYLNSFSHFKLKNMDNQSYMKNFIEKKRKERKD